MTVEVRPLGVTCNISCDYCYQSPQRANASKPKYDIQALLSALETTGRPFTVFGGEPLLVPLDDLSTLWEWGHRRFGHNAVQTNGTLINEQHIELFKRFRVRVGLSIDGPGELNAARAAIVRKRTDAQTEKTLAAIDWLCREGITPSIIVTLHKANASASRLPRLREWICSLDEKGIIGVRLHLLEVDDEGVRAQLALSTDENVAALRSLRALQRDLTHVRFDIFRDMRRVLLGSDESVSCIWKACDPYTTPAVHGIEGHGRISNCSRTNKDGIDFVKSSHRGYERYVSLYATPQSKHGCRDCRFFFACKGQCPGTGVDRDWRNRSEHCDVWKALLADEERALVLGGYLPLSLSEERAGIERTLLAAWSSGRNPSIASLRRGESSNMGAQVASHEHGRLGFVSTSVEEMWSSRIDAITHAIREVEIDQVQRGVRRFAERTVSTSDIVGLDGELGRRSLQIIPLAIAPFEYDGHAMRVRICKEPSRKRSKVSKDVSSPCGKPHATISSSHPKGYIVFRDCVARESRPDWRMNALLSVMHLSLLPFFPCATDCSAAAALVKDALEVSERLGYTREMRWLAEILSAPLLWSSRNGIVEAKTPLFRYVSQVRFMSDIRIVWGTRHGHTASGDALPSRNGRSHRLLPVYRE